MKLLSIDTSTEACSVALLCDGNMFEDHRLAPRQHSQLVLPMIESVLAENGVELGELDALAFGRGPGSFMGVRTATGVIQGIALARDLPVVPVSSLAAMAQSFSDENGEDNILVSIDARMSEVYWAMYKKNGTGLVELCGEEQVLVPEKVPLPDDNEWVGVGTGWRTYQEELTTRCGERLKYSKGEHYPRASSIARLAEPQVESGNVISAEQVLPVYIRDKVAEKP